MMNKPTLYYVNSQTGEMTESHAEAMGWYREKIDVELYNFSEVLGEWVKRGEWVW